MGGGALSGSGWAACRRTISTNAWCLRGSEVAQEGEGRVLAGGQVLVLESCYLPAHREAWNGLRFVALPWNPQRLHVPRVGR